MFNTLLWEEIRYEHRYFQDQIFLHEDEDGQLYFKDDNGALQPVYLTEDGNYAIAETDENVNKETRSQQNSNEEENFILPDVEQKSTSIKQVLFYTNKLHWYWEDLICHSIRAFEIS